MKKKAIATALVLTMALGAGALAGCATERAGYTGNDDIPTGAPPLMPPTHVGRADNLGAAGCYGCHGANDLANPMLNGATALPDDHYKDGNVETKQIEPTRKQCITCHPQG